MPEIALTPAVAGPVLAPLRRPRGHSALRFHDAERAEQWRRIRSGAATVVVGTRSGVFAPVRNLGLIVVDEEHDGSYKQEETPRYNGRDVAIVRAQAAGRVVVLGSATPSLESRYNAERGKYTLLELPERIEQRPMPDVELIDMRQEFLETRKQATFSRRLVEAIAERLENGEQTMVLLNRRGFSSFVACRACGERVQCVNCSVTLTYHRRDRRLLCHYCGYAEKVPSVCPKCGSEYLHFLGIGSEKVEEELHRDFPDGAHRAPGPRHGHRQAPVRNHPARLSRGQLRHSGGHADDRQGPRHSQRDAGGRGVRRHRARAAGFPRRRAHLSTADAGGRTRRARRPAGHRAHPDHQSRSLRRPLRFAAGLRGFLRKGDSVPPLMRYPPFSALANVLVRSEKQEEALRMSTELGRLLDPAPEGVKVLGPAEAPVPRLKSEFRYQFLIKAAEPQASERAAARRADVRAENTSGAPRRW